MVLFAPAPCRDDRLMFKKAPHLLNHQGQWKFRSGQARHRCLGGFCNRADKANDSIRSVVLLSLWNANHLSRLCRLRACEFTLTGHKLFRRRKAGYL
jgi:hypothetical protein